MRDETITLHEAARRLPSINGRRIHYATVRKWARVGIGGIRLETHRLGGRTVTTPDALARFFAALDGERGS